MRVKDGGECSRPLQLTCFTERSRDRKLPIERRAGAKLCGPLKRHKSGPTFPGKRIDRGCSEPEFCIKSIPICIVQKQGFDEIG